MRHKYIYIYTYISPIVHAYNLAISREDLCEFIAMVLRKIIISLVLFLFFFSLCCIHIHTYCATKLRDLLHLKLQFKVTSKLISFIQYFYIYILIYIFKLIFLYDFILFIYLKKYIYN